MCGILSCFYNKTPDFACLDIALSTMRNRGPDGGGTWHSEGVYLGHRRLSILDLDDRSLQPMHSNCGRFSILFNGEIYNYKELRLDLEKKGFVFRTKSDTEVILSLFKYYRDLMLPLLRGMFAFVIWDSIERMAFAARDQYGIKPLYIANIPYGIMLGSQVKALVSTGMVDKSPDPVGQAGYWMLGSVPEPHTWYLNIKALPAGHLIWIQNGKVIRQNSWQDITDVWRNASINNYKVNVKSKVETLVRSALVESVDRHLISDVPVGVFLSGGIDSGALAALMVERGSSMITGVTVAFDEYSGTHIDEVPFAASIAASCGIRHHVRRVTREEFIADLPRILHAMDQPSIDGINTWYAAKAVAEQGLKVVVSGVGGDELFLGYRSFRYLPRLIYFWKCLSMLPGMMKIAQSVSELLTRTSGNGRWRHVPEWLKNPASAWWLSRSSLAPETVFSIMGKRNCIFLENFSPKEWIDWMSGTLAQDKVLALAQIESSVYLKNQLLRDSDWSSMDHSVELRTPLVDFTLLSGMKGILPQMQHYTGKSLLANAPLKPLPEIVVRRSKSGFSIPIKLWFSELHGKDLSWQNEVAKTYGNVIT